MSQPERKTITCPKCGSEIEFTLWKSINTDMSFAIDDIISGKLFFVECESCGHVTRVDYPMLFNDMIHQVMISYEFSSDKSSQNDLDGIGQFAKIMSPFYRNGIRIVDTQNKLREKVQVFNDNLDDHVIEIYKYSLIFMFFQQYPDLKLSIPAYYLHRGGVPQFQLMADDGQNYFAPFDEDTYIKLKAAYMESSENAGDNGNAIVVDYEWAKKYIEEKMLPLVDG